MRLSCSGIGAAVLSCALSCYGCNSEDGTDALDADQPAKPKAQLVQEKLAETKAKWGSKARAPRAMPKAMMKMMRKGGRRPTLVDEESGP
jgi:hypothetical protein